MKNENCNFIVKSDIDKWAEYSIRFCLGFYEKIVFYCDCDDEDLICEIIHSFMSLIDGLAPDVRDKVQPSLGFINEPATLALEEEKPPTVLLPIFAVSSITEIAERVVVEIHNNSFFDGERHALMSQEKFIELRKLMKL